jgi:hypothetical protein
MPSGLHRPQECARLRAAATAAESLAAGLRAEKALWSEELGSQGARLAQDRGRLEAKIEALAAERASLAKQLEVQYLLYLE